MYNRNRDAMKQIAKGISFLKSVPKCSVWLKQTPHYATYGFSASSTRFVACPSFSLAFSSLYIACSFSADTTRWLVIDTRTRPPSSCAFAAFFSFSPSSASATAFSHSATSAFAFSSSSSSAYASPTFRTPTLGVFTAYIIAHCVCAPTRSARLVARSAATSFSPSATSSSFAGARRRSRAHTTAV